MNVSNSVKTHDDLIRSVLGNLLDEHYTLSGRHERLLRAAEDLLWFKNLKTLDPVIYSGFKVKKEAAWKALERAVYEGRKQLKEEE